MQLEERKLKEIEHTDRRRRIVTGYEYETDCGVNSKSSEFITDEEGFAEHFSNMKFYSITRSSVTYRDGLLFDDIRGCTALDYCGGNGEVGVEMAARGAAAVHGIDISQVAVDNARRRAARQGVAGQCRFEVMDAEKTAFADDTFDVVHEYGSLHHLDLHSAFRELARIVKPQGCVICTEALRHNPLIHRYRRRTPQLRTAWEVEHILGSPEIYSGRRRFDELPQLINVLLGEMSFVGPRPEVAEYTDQYTEEEQAILFVRPGITDLSSLEFSDLQEVVGSADPDQVFRRDVLPRKIALRLKYVRQQSMLGDLRILILTICHVPAKPLGNLRWKRSNSPIQTGR